MTQSKLNKWSEFMLIRCLEELAIHGASPELIGSVRKLVEEGFFVPIRTEGPELGQMQYALALVDRRNESRRKSKNAP